jgi:hypothetical protein
VAYLSNEIDSTFSDKLQQFILIKDVEKRTSEQLQYIVDLNIQPDLLKELSDLQCSILLLTILGYSLEQVSRYNRVKQAKINLEMIVLSKHPLWVAHGTKTKSHSN